MFVKNTIGKALKLICSILLQGNYCISSTASQKEYQVEERSPTSTNKTILCQPGGLLLLLVVVISFSCMYEHSSVEGE